MTESATLADDLAKSARQAPVPHDLGPDGEFRRRIQQARSFKRTLDRLIGFTRRFSLFALGPVDEVLRWVGGEFFTAIDV